MELNQLKVFCAIIEKKSFSKASEILFLSQPTISYQIKSLEQELKTKLLDRSGREIIITGSGEIFYKYARRILQLVGEAEQAIQQLNGLIKGELIIGASTTPGEYILPGLFAGFKMKYPGINITMIISDTKEIIKKVIENEVEAGVVGAKEKNDKLVFESFTTEKLVLITSAKSKTLKNETAVIEKLKELPFIFRESGSGTNAVVKKILNEAGVREEDLNIVMRLGSTAAVKKAVECGAGVSFISEKAVENEIKLGTIKKITVKNLELDREFFIVYKRQKSQSPAVKAMLQFLLTLNI
jgi:DNA-binding transcriptional LysR family regulator